MAEAEDSALALQKQKAIEADEFRRKLAADEVARHAANQKAMWQTTANGYTQLAGVLGNVQALYVAHNQKNKKNTLDTFRTQKAMAEGIIVATGAAAAIQALLNPDPISKWIDFGAVVASTGLQLATAEQAEFSYATGRMPTGVSHTDQINASIGADEMVMTPNQAMRILTAQAQGNSTDSRGGSGGSVNVYIDQVVGGDQDTIAQVVADAVKYANDNNIIAGV